jgi:uncharacterized membrane protein (UPF0127 family)
MNIAATPLASLAQRPESVGMQTVTLKINDSVARAEVADTPSLQQKGLMFRESLAKDHGMVFVFSKPERYCMWMKNTPLPLSVAFIDAAGRIVNVEAMQPLTENSHCAGAPVPYALEMEQGWFRKKNITVGDRVLGLPSFRH